VVTEVVTMRLDTDNTRRGKNQGFLGQIASEVGCDSYQTVPDRNSRNASDVLNDGNTMIFNAKTDDKPIEQNVVSDQKGRKYRPLTSFSSDSGSSGSSNGKSSYFTRILGELDCVDKASKVYNVADKGKNTELNKRVKWLETAFVDQDKPIVKNNGSDSDSMDLVMSLIYRIKALKRHGLCPNAESELELMAEDLNQLIDIMK